MARKRWGTVLLWAGVALILFTLGQYGQMAWTQHRLRDQFQRRWQHINSPTEQVPTAAVAPSERVASLRLLIPSIHLDDVVVRGTSYHDLLIAPGLLEGSPLPSARSGAGGNTVIAGHRDTFFRHVADLQPGDRIELETAGREFDYQVYNREIVKPADVSVLDNTAQPRLTLVTCYPTYWIGPAPDRLIVQAAMVGIMPPSQNAVN